MTTQMNQKQAADAIRNLQPFDASALHGRTVKYFWYNGRRCADLPSEVSYLRVSESDWNTMRCYLNAGAVDYVVYSYETPIAYYTISDGWIVLDKKHSVTTSRHTGIVRRAIAPQLESRALVAASGGTRW